MGKQVFAVDGARGRDSMNPVLFGLLLGAAFACGLAVAYVAWCLWHEAKRSDERARP